MGPYTYATLKFSNPYFYLDPYIYWFTKSFHPVWLFGPVRLFGPIEYILGHPQTQHSTGAMRQGETELLKYLHYIIGQDEAKVFTYVKTHISVSSAGSQQCWYQAVVCISTPRRYMRRRHFFLNNEWIWVHINISSMDQSEFKRIWSITDNMWLIFFFFNWIQRFFNHT